MWYRILAGIIILNYIIITSCSPTSNQYHATIKDLDKYSGADTLLYYYKSACFGKCPQAKIIISGDLEYKYNGISNISPPGKVIRSFTKEEIKTIYSIAEQANFYELNDRYPTNKIMDAQTITLGLRKADKMKYVDFQMIAPDSVKQLFFKIDTLLMDKARSKKL